MNRYLTLTSLALLFAGCRTTEEILNDYNADIVAGNFEKASAEVGEVAAKEDDSVVMWRLLTAGAQYLADDKQNALKTFDLVEDAFSVRDHEGALSGAGETSLSILANERTIPYRGTGEDRVFTCFYKAVDYAAQGKRDAARTELNRAAQHQENWLWERREEIKEASEKLEKDSADYAKKEGDSSTDTSKVANATESAVGNDDFCAQIRENCGFDPRTSGNLENLGKRDYLNAYVQHATGIFRWLNGDGGRDYLQSALDVKPEHPLVASDFAVCDSGRPQNQVWVYVEDGLCSVRQEWRIDLPMVLIPYANRYVLYAGMAFPKLVERPAAANGYTLRGDNDERTGLVELEDIDHLLKTEFDVYMSGCIKREITRTLVKVAVQVGFGIACDQTNDWRTQLALRAGQVGAATWAASTTAADLRTWTTLPKKVYAMRVTRPANGHLVLEGDGAVIADITLPEGNSMIFVRKTSAAAPAVVKSVVFN